MNDRVEISVVVPVGTRYDDIHGLYQEYKAALESSGRTYDLNYVLDGDVPSVLQQLTSLQNDGEQIQIIFYDDIVAKPRRVLADLARHIGIDHGFFEALPEEVLARRARPGPGLPPRPSLLPVLHGLYDERINALAKLTGRELESWRVAGG